MRVWICENEEYPHYVVFSSEDDPDMLDALSHLSRITEIPTRLYENAVRIQKLHHQMQQELKALYYHTKEDAHEDPVEY